MDYDGPRDKDGIVDWLAQKTDPNWKPPQSEVRGERDRGMGSRCQTCYAY